MLGVFETAATARVRNSGSGSKCHCIPSSKLQHDGPAKSIGWLRTANTVCHQRRMRTWNRSMKAKQACVLTAKLQHLSDLAGPPPPQQNRNSDFVQRMPVLPCEARCWQLLVRELLHGPLAILVFSAVESFARRFQC